MITFVDPIVGESGIASGLLQESDWTGGRVREHSKQRRKEGVPTTTRLSV